MNYLKSGMLKIDKITCVLSYFSRPACIFAATALIASDAAAQNSSAEVVDTNPSTAQVAPETPQEAQLSSAEERALQSLNSEYGSEVEQRWREILAQDGLQEGENERNVFIATGLATVAMEKGAPGWIESRRIAFDVAYARAKTDLVSAMGQTIQRSGNAQFTSNASFGQGQIQQVESVDRAARIRDKVGELTESALDAALREIDPDIDTHRFREMSVPERQVAIENLFEQTSYRAAARVIAGATTYRIIEGPSANGQNHEILVAMVWSPRLSGLAAAIQDGRTEMRVDMARTNTREILPQNVGAAVSAFGTRVFVDENGDRALISFAQTEPAQVNAADIDIARRAALSAAEDIAIGQIAAFVSENVALESETQSQQLTQIYADLVQRGVEINTEQVQTIRSASGRINIAGAQPIWRQVVQHPETEQDMAIVAVAWSPSSQAMGQRMSDTMDAANSDSPDPENPVSETAPDAGNMSFESEPVDPNAL